MRDNMGDHSHGSPDDSGTVAKAGTGTLDKFQDPGLPPHRPRLADTDPHAEKRAERQVALLFIISIIGTLSFFVGLLRSSDVRKTSSEIRVQNALLGLGTAFAMLGIGIGIVHWAKTLMPDHEVIEDAPRDPPRRGPPGRREDHRRHHRRDRHQAPSADPQHPHRCHGLGPDPGHRHVPRPRSLRQTPAR